MLRSTIHEACLTYIEARRTQYVSPAPFCVVEVADSAKISRRRNVV